jgi:hypothetical protein
MRGGVYPLARSAVIQHDELSGVSAAGAGESVAVLWVGGRLRVLVLVHNAQPSCQPSAPAHSEASARRVGQGHDTSPISSSPLASAQVSQ